MDSDFFTCLYILYSMKKLHAKSLHLYGSSSILQIVISEEVRYVEYNTLDRNLRCKFVR